jgi:hypothetical protein
MSRLVSIAGLSGLPLAIAASSALSAIVASSALSREADDVYKAARDVLNSAERSEVLFGDKAEALSDLARLGTECADPGWDGDDAAPIDPITLFLTKRFILALPYGIPMPEFAAEPDGKISLDWSQSRSRQFSLTIGHGDRLAFAWMDGADKGHAIAQFDGVNIPSLVLDQIRRLVGNAHTSLWAA